MSISSALDLLAATTIRTSLILLSAWALAWVLRARGAAVRHLIYRASLIVCLSIPLLLAVAPRISIPITTRAALPVWLPPVAAIAPPTQTELASPVTSRVEAAHGVARRGIVPIGILLLWALGAGVLLARLGRNEVAAGRLRRGSRSCTDPWIGTTLREVARAHGWGTSRVRVAHAGCSPAVSGVLRPVILLPSDAVRWPAAELRLVLAHELGHIARGDCMAQLIGRFACAIYWFNPLVWIVARLSRLESERACDDVVIKLADDRRDYARLLVRNARNSINARHALGMARPQQLSIRVRAILDGHATREAASGRVRAFIALSACVLAIVATALRLDARPSTSLLQWPEPDTQGDSLTNPESERLPFVEPTAAQVVAALAGPDSILAGALWALRDQHATWRGDLRRDRAMWALAQSREGRIIDPLLAALESPDWRARAYAAWTLAIQPTSRAVPRLIAEMASSNWRARAMAAHALASARDARARDAMVTALRDPAWQVRSAAVEYIAALRDPSDAALLDRARRDRHIAVRAAAAKPISR